MEKFVLVEREFSTGKRVLQLWFARFPKEQLYSKSSKQEKNNSQKESLILNNREKMEPIKRINKLRAQLQINNVAAKSSAEEMGGMGDKLLKKTAEDKYPRSPSIWNKDKQKTNISKSSNLRGKTVFIAGASRGIGKAIALKCARDGANVVVTGKTSDPHPTLPGTVFTAAEECKVAGGDALGLVMDVRDEESVKAAVEAAVKRFGGVDVCISCASAIFPQPLGKMNTKRFDLMMSINSRGTVLVVKSCIPYLKESARKGNNPHVITLSPPLYFDSSLNLKTNYMVAKGEHIASKYRYVFYILFNNMKVV